MKLHGGVSNRDHAQEALRKMANAFVEKLRGYAPLEAGDETLLGAACQNTRKVAPGVDLICEGEEPNAVFVVLEGWACRYKRSEERRVGKECW